MPELNHLLPMDVHAENDKKGYKIGHDDVSIEERTRDVADGEHAEDVSTFSRNIAQVVDNIDGDKNGACEEGNASEQPPHKPQEPEEGNGIKTDFVQELWLFRV